jgi:hypothetical protein
MGAVVSPPARRTVAAMMPSAFLLAGCGPPPQVEPTPDGPLPGPDTPQTPSMPAPGGPGPAPATPTTGQDEAVDCDGNPGEDEVLAVLREADLLDADVEVSLLEGPLCAGDWQYAVVSVPDRDPLQVITSGPPDELTLVTAGTEVCTVEVRVHAPRGIRAAASCVG